MLNIATVHPSKGAAVKLQPIGRVENPDELDLDPIEVPIVAYANDRSEVITEIRFRAVQPMGASLDVLRETRGDGNVPLSEAIKFLDDCILLEDRKKWEALIHDPELTIEQTTYSVLYRELCSVYAARPTQRLSGSHSGQRKPKQTSRDAARKRASGTSTHSPSTLAST
jgi:hypothetical protein